MEYGYFTGFSSQLQLALYHSLLQAESDSEDRLNGDSERHLALSTRNSGSGFKWSWFEVNFSGQGTDGR